MVSFLLVRACGVDQMPFRNVSFRFCPGRRLYAGYCYFAPKRHIREVWIHDERFAARLRSMMRIMARRTNAATAMELVSSSERIDVAA